MQLVDLREFDIPHRTELGALAERVNGVFVRKPINYNTVPLSLNPLVFTISPQIPVVVSYIDLAHHLREKNDIVAFTETVTTNVDFSMGGFVGAAIFIRNVQPEAGPSGMFIDAVTFNLVLRLSIWV